MVIIILILLMIITLAIGMAIGSQKTYKKLVETAILAHAKELPFTIKHSNKTVELIAVELQVDD